LTRHGTAQSLTFDTTHQRAAGSLGGYLPGGRHRRPAIFILMAHQRMLIPAAIGSYRPENKAWWELVGLRF